MGNVARLSRGDFRIVGKPEAIQKRRYGKALRSLVPARPSANLTWTPEWIGRDDPQIALPRLPSQVANDKGRYHAR